jgi:hypothetical protein
MQDHKIAIANCVATLPKSLRIANAAGPPASL